MAVTLLKNIKQLVGVREQSPVLRGPELTVLPCIDNAYLLIEDDEIAGYGPMSELSTVNRQPSTAPAVSSFLPGATAIPILSLPPAAKPSLSTN